MTQQNMRKGLQKFGDRGAVALEKDIRQLLSMDDIDPDGHKDMTKQDWLTSLAYLIFLKEELDRSIKGRDCCYGCSQYDYMKKEEMSSPTLTWECLMLSFVTDTMESFDITTTDIPSVLLQTNMEVPVWVRLCAILSEMLLKMDPQKIQIQRHH